MLYFKCVFNQIIGVFTGFNRTYYTDLYPTVVMCLLYFNILLTSFFFFNVCLFFFFFFNKIISYSLRTIVSLEIIGFQFTKIYYQFLFYADQIHLQFRYTFFSHTSFLTGLKSKLKKKKDNFTHYKTLA